MLPESVNYAGSLKRRTACSESSVAKTSEVIIQAKKKVMNWQGVGSKGAINNYCHRARGKIWPNLREEQWRSGTSDRKWVPKEVTEIDYKVMDIIGRISTGYPWWFKQAGKLAFCPTIKRIPRSQSGKGKCQRWTFWHPLILGHGWGRAIIWKWEGEKSRRPRQRAKRKRSEAGVLAHLRMKNSQLEIVAKCKVS